MCHFAPPRKLFSPTTCFCEKQENIIAFYNTQRVVFCPSGFFFEKFVKKMIDLMIVKKREDVIQLVV